ncbi:13859_t:CDS:2 [Cetraspora pellucida]|uniref:13859_t:CDS:1 n=1 Tax=Cetraspora pellucida TaxID=1433469 RepID=A0ACA9MSV3_9GLOM|nr:13859_t:CDS:2 [Cetraspora pellucida]
MEIDKHKNTIFPVRVSGNHWGMFVLKDQEKEVLDTDDKGEIVIKKKPETKVYYTSSGAGAENEIQQIKPLIEQIVGENGVKNIQIIKGPKQKNGYDCGWDTFKETDIKGDSGEAEKGAVANPGSGTEKSSSAGESSRTPTFPTKKMARTENDDRDKIIEKLTKERDEAKNELQELEKVANDYYNYAKGEVKAKENELNTANSDKDNAEENVEEKNKVIEELNNKIIELDAKIAENNLVIANSVSQEDYKKVAAERDRRPNISQAEYEKVIAERDEYSKRPTKGQLDKAAESIVKNGGYVPATDYQGWIDPNELEEKAKERGMEHNKTENQLKVANQANEKLTKAKADLERQLADKEGNQEAAAEEIKILEYLLQLAEQNRDKTQDKVKELKDQLSELKTALNERPTAEQLAILQTKYQKIVDKLQEVNEKLKEVNRNNSAASEENKELIKNLARWERLNERQNATITELKNQLKEVKKEATKSVQEINKIEAKLAAANKLSKREQKTIQELRNKYVKSEAETERECENELAKLKQQLEQEKKNRDATEKKLKDRAQDNDNLQQQVYELERKSRKSQIQTKKELTAKEKELRELERAAELLLEAFRAAEDQAREDKDTIKDLENQIAILEAFKEAHESKHNEPKKRRISDVDDPARLKRIIVEKIQKLIKQNDELENKEFQISELG